ncbi:MAG: DUF1080 domain-containing protein, partial [Candidatus Solibacter usitatus]|nr:DUF1080 domain-containing protein [Candidatus Solibacter usitatus]
MQLFRTGLILVSALLAPAFAQTTGSPFVGRWNFNISTPGGMRASWLGVTEKDGALEVWYQPTGGNVFKLKNIKAAGAHLTLTVSSPSGKGTPTTWELDARGDQLSGVQKRGENSVPLTGVRAPDLKRGAPAAWSKPEPIFNGRDLTGWEPLGNPANSHWTVKDGLLINTDHGANLKTTARFDDFKLHFEVNCPDHANSGF